MVLDSSEAWPAHQFRLRYTVSLAEDSSIELELSAENCNTDKEFSFTSALHTYFR